ncbi:streptococcal hemagglutinin-like [Eurosta solidaginis]|uniref:streptococcal hemagglutinin-like n=1 Tax=Eurosta solidaginis TaxID=178769 RepID=UPI003531035C
MPLGTLPRTPVRRKSPRFQEDQPTESEANTPENSINVAMSSVEGNNIAQQVQQSNLQAEVVSGEGNSQRLQEEGGANNVNNVEAHNNVISVLQKQIAALESELKRVHNKVRENEAQNCQLKLAVQHHTMSTPVTNGNIYESSNQVMHPVNFPMSYATVQSSVAPSADAAAPNAASFVRATHNAMQSGHSAAPDPTASSNAFCIAMPTSSVLGAIVSTTIASDVYNAIPGTTTASATFANLASDSYSAMSRASVASATKPAFANNDGDSYCALAGASIASANYAGVPYKAMSGAPAASAKPANCAAPFASAGYSASVNVDATTFANRAVASFSTVPFAAAAKNIATTYHNAAPTTTTGVFSANSVEAIYGTMPHATRSFAATDIGSSNAPGYNAVPAFQSASGYSASLDSTPAISSSYGNVNNTLPPPPVSRPISMPSTLTFPRKLQDLPEFSGLAEDWPLFINAFIESTSAYGYSMLENNQRLQKSLKGEARETVKSLLIHPDNVDAVIAQLRFRFGRPEQLIQSQLAAVKEISPISENGVVKIISLATKVKNLSAFLQTAGGHQHLANPTLISELINKLPMSKRLEWARYSSAIQPYPTVVHLSEWLSEIASLICKVQEHEPREPKRRVVLHAVEEQPTHKSKCVMCQNYHKLQECERFLNASVADRWKFVKSQRLCFACLARGHSSRQCRRRKTCLSNGCKKTHHKLLHDAIPVHRPAEKSASDIQDRRTPNSASVLSCVTNVKSSKLLFRILPVAL